MHHLHHCCLLQLAKENWNTDLRRSQKKWYYLKTAKNSAQLGLVVTCESQYVHQTMDNVAVSLYISISIYHNICISISVTVCAICVSWNLNMCTKPPIGQWTKYQFISYHFAFHIDWTLVQPIAQCNWYWYYNVYNTIPNVQ